MLKEIQSMKKLKDLSLMTFTEDDAAPIAEQFGLGASSNQKAFQMLLTLCVVKLAPFTEERKSGLKLVTGALKKLGKLMEGSLLDTLNLSTTYCAPARQLAKASIEGTTVPCQYVIDHFEDTGESEEGDLPGPLFAPSRLIVSMKNLRLSDEKSAFWVDDEDGLMLKDKNGTSHRFGSLSIEGIKDILRTGTTDPETLDLINTLFGVFTDEGEKPKPGIIGREVAKLVKAANAGEESDQFALDIAEALVTVQLDCREAAIRRNREERASKEAESDMNRAQKRLKAQQALGAERNPVPASVVHTDEREASES